MKSFDFYAVAYAGAVHCTEHLPEGITLNTEGVYPIFADSEWEAYPVCDVCLREFDYVVLLQPNQERP